MENTVITKENATPEQLNSGEYEVDGVKGGQGRTQEELIASANTVMFSFAVLIIAAAGLGVFALAQRLIM